MTAGRCVRAAGWCIGGVGTKALAVETRHSRTSLREYSYLFVKVNFHKLAWRRAFEPPADELTLAFGHAGEETRPAQDQEWLTALGRMASFGVMRVLQVK